MNWTWEQKFDALNALAECSLKMRAPGNWYVSQPYVSIYNGTIERSAAASGTTPETAVNAEWQARVTDLKDKEVLFLVQSERYVRWNGFMWVDVGKPT